MKEKTLRILTSIGKWLGAITAMGAIPFIPQSWGVIIFMVVSGAKEVSLIVGDYIDDGQRNNSFKP